MSLCVVLFQFVSITKKKSQHFCLKLIRIMAIIRVHIKNTAFCFHDNIVLNAFF